ncbi:MAG: HEAT repeat domain-containing protein [Kiritimatiellales bacterium]|nr:HEAT repeat domain-containing protein [Kiritimatiellales bacterium]
MQKTTKLAFAAMAAILMLGLVGCSRTSSDIAKWKAKGNVEKLIGALQDPKANIRQAAATALGELKAEAAVEPLAALFNDPESSVGLRAIDALVAIGNGPATGHLISALQLTNSNARALAATGLGTLNATHAVDALIAALDDSAEPVQCAVASSLGAIGEEKASGPLAEKLKAPSPTLRLACAQALGSTKGSAAIKGLIGAMADDNDTVRTAVTASLVSIGTPSVPAALDALRDDNEAMRQGAIAVLQGLNAIPTSGENLIWYELARVAVGNKTDLDMALVDQLARMDGDAVDTLLEAAGHNVSTFRNHAFRALENIGQPCAAKAVAAATSHAGPAGRMWFNARSTWSGAPSWRLDLWGALTALNPAYALDKATAANLQAQGRTAFRVISAPDFAPTRETTPLLIRLLSDETVPPPEQPDVDEAGMPVIKRSVDRFRGEANQQMAKERLVAAGDLAVFPLLAALYDRNNLIASHAAAILGEMGDHRALDPLIGILKGKLAKGEELTNSPFYAALQKMDDPSAEPVLLKIMPDSERAFRVFERHYTNIRVNVAEKRDYSGQTITYRLGYVDKSDNLGQMDVTFARNAAGDWKPSPGLPDELPQ